MKGKDNKPYLSQQRRISFSRYSQHMGIDGFIDLPAILWPTSNVPRVPRDRNLFLPANHHHFGQCPLGHYDFIIYSQ